MVGVSLDVASHNRMREHMITACNDTRPAICPDGSFLQNSVKKPGANPLTGPRGDTTENSTLENREISEVSHPVDTTGYNVLSWGIDSIQESYNAQLKPSVMEVLEKAKAEAAELDPSRETGVIVNIAGYDVEVKGKGATGGSSFVIATGSWMVLFAKNRDWAVNVRYLADGLWLRDLDELRTEISTLIYEVCLWEGEGPPKVSLSRADFCFDVHSPEFTEEMRPEILSEFCKHSSCKFKAHSKDLEGMHGRGKQLETVTIGSKKGLELQVYDKTKEITEASGKTYMYDRWCDPETGEVPDADMWRVELRFGKDFLKNRKVNTLDDFLDNIDELRTEAMHKIRLTERNGDSNLARRPYHPLWSVCLKNYATHDILPIDRTVDGQRIALREQAIKQIAGSLRSATVLCTGNFFDEQTMNDIMDEAKATLFMDQKHQEKTLIAMMRYLYVKGRPINVTGCDDV